MSMGVADVACSLVQCTTRTVMGYKPIHSMIGRRHKTSGKANASVGSVYVLDYSRRHQSTRQSFEQEYTASQRLRNAARSLKCSTCMVVYLLLDDGFVSTSAIVLLDGANEECSVQGGFRRPRLMLPCRLCGASNTRPSSLRSSKAGPVIIHSSTVSMPISHFRKLDARGPADRITCQCRVCCNSHAQFLCCASVHKSGTEV